MVNDFGFGFEGVAPSTPVVCVEGLVLNTHGSALGWGKIALPTNHGSRESRTHRVLSPCWLYILLALPLIEGKGQSCTDHRLSFQTIHRQKVVGRGGVVLP